MFKSFRGNDPEYIDKVDFPIYDTGILIGNLDGILYTTIRDGVKEKYIHKFKIKSRPLLISSYDGNQLYILKGGYNFTDRGIVDK